MNPLFDTGLEFQNFFQYRKWKFCFIGGLALLRWGQVRMTEDVDVSLLTGFGSEDKYIKELLSVFKTRIADAHNFAAENRVLLLTSSKGVPVDISLSGLPFEKEMIKRATRFDYTPACSLVTCSAEDLVVLKAFADRKQDWVDIEGIFVRQGKKLDNDYIFSNLRLLCEAMESNDTVEKLKELLESL